jgi:NAD(P)-dependent dehydrogenase (short-subunit alcohol dehydrogenase family)
MTLLDKKVCIVTGVGPGLGRQTALALAAHGAQVVVAARTESFLGEVVGEIGVGRALAVPTNIVKADECQRLMERTVDEYGRVDCLVNCAFRPDVFQPFESVDLTLWRKIADVNLWGGLQLAQAAVPVMKEQGGGSIVFVNSMVVRKPSGLQGGYATSKGALLTAAQALAHELGQYRIRVNSVVPGWMWGPPVQGLFEMLAMGGETTVEEEYAKRTAEMPLGEMPTDADVAKAIVFFASDLSSAITGQSLDVNGGEVFV